MTDSQTLPRPYCGTCGSDDIVSDAWAAWDSTTQGWVLSAVFDAAWCHACEATASIAWTSSVEARETCL